MNRRRRYQVKTSRVDTLKSITGLVKYWPYQIAYYQVGLRGITKTNLLRSESVAKLCLPVEGLELEPR